jgi:hypothetical protein
MKILLRIRNSVGKKRYDAEVVWPFGKQTNENRFSGLY